MAINRFNDGDVLYAAPLNQLVDEINNNAEESASIKADLSEVITSYEVVSPNIFDDSKIDTNGYIDTSTGEDKPSSSFKRTTEYTNVDVSKSNIYLFVTEATPTFMTVWYNDSNTVVTAMAFNTSTPNVSVVKPIPTNATKFRLYTNASFNGRVAFGYEPFTEFVEHTEVTTVRLKDNIISLDNLNSHLKNKVDYTPKKILLLGDSILGYDKSTSNKIIELIGSEVINCAFGGTSISKRTDTSSAFYPFDGENLIPCIASGDFTSQESKITQTGQIAYREKLTNLEQLDMSTVDMVVLCYGTNDYTQGKTIEQITSAYSSCIDIINQINPLIRILIVTPLWRYFDGGDDGDTKVYNVSTLKEIASSIVEFAKNKRVNVLNAYQTFNLNTYTMGTFCVNDSGSYVHLKPVGGERFAHLICGKIRSMC